jgi:hypothetical protein
MRGAEMERFVCDLRATERRVVPHGVHRTERLRLVPIGARHALELWELHRDEGIARWYPLSREQALRFAERMERGWRDRGVGKWLAYEGSTGSLVGFRRAVWGRGYATEIGHAGLDYAFSVLGVEEVVAFTEVHNARSRGHGAPGVRHVGQILRPGLIAGSAVVHEEAPLALYRITRPPTAPVTRPRTAPRDPAIGR